MQQKGSNIYKKVIYTVGHSNHSAEYFLELLYKYGITAVADVRSVPYSRYNPQFNKKEIQSLLSDAGIEYVFLGKELGGRPDNAKYYHEGKVDYSLIAAEPSFQKAIRRLLKGSEKYRIVLLCAEKDPYSCHRALLVGRELEKLGIIIRHILEDGVIK